MEDPKIKIYPILEKVASDLGVEASNFLVEKPKDSSHGDFSSNIAMVLYKTIKTGPNSPLDLAKEIVEMLNTKYKILDTDFDKVEIAAPGFVNFYLSPKYLQSQLEKIIEKADNYGSLEIGKGKKASVEFV